MDAGWRGRPAHEQRPPAEVLSRRFRGCITRFKLMEEVELLELPSRSEILEILRVIEEEEQQVEMVERVLPPTDLCTEMLMEVAPEP